MTFIEEKSGKYKNLIKKRDNYLPSSNLDDDFLKYCQDHTLKSY